MSGTATDRFDELLRKKRLTPAETVEARALLGWDAPKSCRYCGEDVGIDRRCFAVPVCVACLPPPPPVRSVRGEVAP